MCSCNVESISNECALKIRRLRREKKIVNDRRFSRCLELMERIKHKAEFMCGKEVTDKILKLGPFRRGA